MSLQETKALKDIQTAELERYTTPEGEERISHLRIKNVRFNYPYLEAPRPSEAGARPRYDVQLIIENEEVFNVIQEYFNHTYEQGVAKVWAGRRPNVAAMNTPVKAPLPDDTTGEPRLFEENAIVLLSASNSQRPQLALHLPGEELTAWTEDDIGEFYSGMIGEAVIGFSAYPKSPGGSPKDGIKAWINGALKTGHGEQLFKKLGDTDYFGLGAAKTSLFNPTPDKQTEAPANAPKPQAPSAGLGNLLQPKGPAVEAPAEAAPTTNTPPVKTNLQDLIKRRP